MTQTFEDQFLAARRKYIASQFANLNPMQQEAVLTTDGPLLLLAGDLSSSCSAIALNPDATQGVTPSGPLCCAAHRAATRLAPSGGGH